MFPEILTNIPSNDRTQLYTFVHLVILSTDLEPLVLR